MEHLTVSYQTIRKTCSTHPPSFLEHKILVLNQKNTYTIDGYEGIWSLDKTYISDLGYLMAKFYHEERGVWMNVNMGHFNDVIVQGTKLSRLTITKEE